MLKKRINYLIVSLVIVAGYCGTIHAKNKKPKSYVIPRSKLGKKITWTNAETYKTPKYTLAPGYKNSADSEIKPILYDGVPVNGKPTKIFAWLGVPKKKHVPGLVLVHSGNGSANKQWVESWLKRGYAAIAMDLNGGVPMKNADGKIVSRRHENGPPGIWNGFENSDKPLARQWMYHAVNAVIRAVSILRSQPNVNPDYIGIIGFSWGSVVAIDALGADSRLKSGVLIHGSGFLGQNSSAFIKKFNQMESAKVMKWLLTWDPAIYIGKTRALLMFCNNFDSSWYPFNSWRQTWRGFRGPKVLCQRVPTLTTENHPEFDKMPEVPIFLESRIGKGKQLLKINKRGVNRFGYFWTLYESGAPLKKVILHYTKDKTGALPGRKWQQTNAVIKRKYVTTMLPPDTAAFYYEFHDTRGCVMSGQMQIVRTKRKKKK
jgi:dienelactone hydrolase